MRKVAGWLCVGILVLWAGAFLVIKASHDRVTEQMVSVADSLAVPSSWTLESEVVESEKLICLNANPCPSLSRTWQTDTQLSADDLRRIAASAGWQVQMNGDCQRSEGAIGKRSVCSATSTDSGFEIELRVDSPEADSVSLLWLHLEASG